MPKVKQQNSSNVRRIVHDMLLSLPQHLRVNYFANYVTVKSNKMFMVEAHRRSAKFQRGSFHEIESIARHF